MDSLSSINDRFIRFEMYDNSFGFLYNIGKLQTMNDKWLDEKLLGFVKLSEHLDNVVASELYEKPTVFWDTLDQQITRQKNTFFSRKNYWRFF